MATYPAIAATSEAILGVLSRAATGTEFDGLDFAQYQTRSFDDPLRRGISLLLYHVTVNPARNQPPRTGLDGRRRLPSLPVDLHYLITAWGDDAIHQQRLLGWAIRVLEDTPILPASILNHHGPEPDVFAPDETVELTWEAIARSDLSDTWQALGAKQQPSASYVARHVLLDSALPLDEYARVQTRVLDAVPAVPAP